jgi:hypothetical protein
MKETRGCHDGAVRRITARFGARSLTAAQITARAEAATTPSAGIVAEKWRILHDLTAARANLGLLSVTLVALEAILPSCPRQCWLRPRTDPSRWSSPRAAPRPSRRQRRATPDMPSSTSTIPMHDPRLRDAVPDNCRPGRRNRLPLASVVASGSHSQSHTDALRPADPEPAGEGTKHPSRQQDRFLDQGVLVRIGRLVPPISRIIRAGI